MYKNDFGDQLSRSINSEDSELFSDRDVGDRQPQLRRLQTFRAGALLFGIHDDQVAATAEWRRPTPLPHAPPAVLGIVCIHGRMWTVLDPLQLLSDTVNQNERSWNFIVALRGDEQLALAIEDNTGAIEIPASDLESTSATAGGAVAAVLRLPDRVINVIEVKELFPTAMRGRERRRRRF